MNIKSMSSLSVRAIVLSECDISWQNWVMFLCSLLVVQDYNRMQVVAILGFAKRKEHSNYFQVENKQEAEQNKDILENALPSSDHKTCSSLPLQKGLWPNSRVRIPIKPLTTQTGALFEEEQNFVRNRGMQISLLLTNVYSHSSRLWFEQGTCGWAHQVRNGGKIEPRHYLSIGLLLLPRV